MTQVQTLEWWWSSFAFTLCSTFFLWIHKADCLTVVKAAWWESCAHSSHRPQSQLQYSAHSVLHSRISVTRATTSPQAHTKPFGPGGDLGSWQHSRVTFRLPRSAGGRGRVCKVKRVRGARHSGRAGAGRGPCTSLWLRRAVCFQCDSVYFHTGELVLVHERNNSALKSSSVQCGREYVSVCVSECVVR